MLEIECLSITANLNGCCIGYKLKNKKKVQIISSETIFTSLSKLFNDFQPKTINKVIVNIGPGKLILQRNLILTAKFISKYYNAELIPFSIFDIIKTDKNFLDKEFYIAVIKGTMKLYYFVYFFKRKNLSEISIASKDEIEDWGYEIVDLADYDQGKIVESMILKEKKNYFYQYRMKKYNDDQWRPPAPLNLTLLSKVI